MDLKNYSDLTTENKYEVKSSVWRLITTVILLAIQIYLIIRVAYRLTHYATWVHTGVTLLTLIVVMTIFGRTDLNSAYKTPWIMLIMAFPIPGLCLYFLSGTPTKMYRMKRRYQKVDDSLFPLVPQDQEVMDDLREKDVSVSNICGYVARYARYPVYKNTDVTYYPDAVDGLEAQKEELKKAKRFIFMEYHAIEDKECFQDIKEILIEKVREGVEVRLFYDDVGSIGFINPNFEYRMEALGIQCRAFNPVTPIINIFMNNRDHRKITVIDGKVGFTGGYNLANEYFHITEPYGHWKDTGVKLEGDAVKNLTVSFLEMWNSVRKRNSTNDTCYDKYLPDIEYKGEDEGFVQPYGDSPLDHEQTGENVYMSILKDAKMYCYFITPYLVLTDEMQREMEMAAKRGVDVRIITPGVPDKKIVYLVTRSFYTRLCQNGVRILEYTPGFCHAKMCVSDDEIATVGTINLDYRSLYLHFENGCFMYDSKAVMDVKKDFLETFKQCDDVTMRYSIRRSLPVRIVQCVLRLLAPLL